MGTIAPVKLSTFLELGRTSNLPTVWSNVLVGAVLSGASLSVPVMAVLIAAGSALYVGGMLLNDAFDAAIDARERPERPIPSGRVSQSEVLLAGFLLLAAGIGTVALASVFDVIAPEATLGAAGTAAAILVYDRWHKGHAWSPIMMGLCRAGLYAMAALAASGTVPRSVLPAAGALLLYVVGLTHVARFENASALGRIWPCFFVFAPLVVWSAPVGGDIEEWLPLVVFLAWTGYALSLALRGGRGRIPRAVVSLIAGISLVDALFLAPYAQGPWLASAAFLLTLLWQRRIRGT
jgi:hypothetical protein